MIPQWTHAYTRLANNKLGNLQSLENQAGPRPERQQPEFL